MSQGLCSWIFNPEPWTQLELDHSDNSSDQTTSFSDKPYTLKMDHEIGSIEAGKIADFAALDASPLEVDPMAIRDIGVKGVVSGGRVFMN